MPLPANSTLILQGQPRPEDMTLSHLKPKKAMLIRMSQETFEALEDGENHGKVEFDFGKTPGLYIGNTFYPVTPNQEHSIHEMYIRVQQASKPNVPLKPYATVVGKFRVQRELGEKVQETVRDRTLEAEKQRTERKAILLDTPPDLSYPGSKTKTKKNAGSASRMPIPAKSYVSSSKALPLPSSTPRPLRAPTPVVSSVDRDTRMRLIHCLALRQRPTSAVLILCLGKERTEEQEQEIVALLAQVAEHPPTSRRSEGSLLWQLKLEAWREVRPYEFTKYNTEEQRDVARQARLKFQTMKIPETDPIWNYVHYRNTSSAAPGPSAPAAEKNGVVMTKKVKKAKTGEGTRKKASDIAIPSKDESGKGKARDVDEGSAAGTPTSLTQPGARRLPGSGFKVKQSATPPDMEGRANSPLSPPRKTVAADSREGKRSALEASGSAKRLPPLARPPMQESRSCSVAAAAAQIRKREKEVQGSSSTSRSVESRREERDRARERERERERVRERDNATDEKPRIKERASPIPLPAPTPLPSFKRKKRPQDGNDSEFSERERPLSASVSKKRKLDADEQPRPVENSRGRDLSLPKKPVVVREPSPLVPRLKIKKEPSPFSAAFSPPRSSLPPNPRSSLPPKPPVAEKQQSSSSTPSAKASRAVDNAPPLRTSGKSKRKSPIYTSSSEDESDREASVPVARPRDRDRDRVPLRDAPSEEPPVKRPRPSVAAAHVSRFKPHRQLPSDLPSLRKYYKVCYSRYMDLFGEATKRRERIQRMLKRADSTRERERGEESARSDEDTEELVPEVLAGFMEEMNVVSQEMKKVMKEYKKLGGKVEGGKPVLD